MPQKARLGARVFFTFVEPQSPRWQVTSGSFQNSLGCDCPKSSHITCPAEILRPTLVVGFTNRGMMSCPHVDTDSSRLLHKRGFPSTDTPGWLLSTFSPRFDFTDYASVLKQAAVKLSESCESLSRSLSTESAVVSHDRASVHAARQFEEAACCYTTVSQAPH